MPIDSTFRRTPNFSLQALQNGLLKQDRISLGKALTIIESKHPEDRKLASELLNLILPKTKKSFRIGISGVPGVGKSTFIEALGTYLTSKKISVAVLSIDPSSSRTRGSILGDKTRMTELSTDPLAFIRPTAAGTSLGGVASNTREAILLCEAAGFEVIIVETVGVGQSETMVKDMVDYFLLLMLAGSGDELQGIKRGIMEIADHILINKADGDNMKAAKKARESFKNAIHLFAPGEIDREVPVGLCSALEKTGIEETWNEMASFQEQMRENGWIDKTRERQSLKWFHEQIRRKLEDDFFSTAAVKDQIKEKEEMISSHKLSVRKAIDDLFKNHKQP